MVSLEKRCLYEVLGVSRDSSADEIRSAYKKLALQRHPDKLVQSGVPEDQATASFQELVHAYEVLSDPRERAFYDSHRSQILFSTYTPFGSSSSAPSRSSSSVFSTVVPNLFSFFSNSVYSGYSDTGIGFYKVYGDRFDKIYQDELNFAKKLGLGLPKEAPVMGNLQSPYAQATAFYNYWLGFVTIMAFCWVDQYDVMAGPNRKSRRVMEEENKKLRKKAKREYNETVRGLAEFVKKRDKRVIDMQLKRKEELERKREEEIERKRKMEKEKAERLRLSAYEEPEWSNIEEEDDEVEENDLKKGDGEELYCVACRKKFKSEKQWKNHEQSKKHKEKVAELREVLLEEERENGEDESEDGEDGELFADEVDDSGFVSTNDTLDDLEERFQANFSIQEEGEDNVDKSSEEEYAVKIDKDGDVKGIDEVSLADDEASILEAMISGHKSQKSTSSMPRSNFPTSKMNVEVDADGMDFEYNNMKGNRRKKGSRREKGKKDNDDAVKVDVAETNTQADANNGYDDSSQLEELLSQSLPEIQSSGKGGDPLERNTKFSVEDIRKKGTTNRDTNMKSKHGSKGRKQKATSKSSGNVCDTCKEEFESRNKLHKHLSDTGHASRKF